MSNLRYSSSIQNISVDFTYRCNLRCLHCYNCSGVGSDKREELTREELIAIAKEIVTIVPETVCICGGEPLLRFDDVLMFTKIIKEGTNSMTNVNIVSNGIILSDIENVIKLKNAGISSIQISLNGAYPETHDWLRNSKGVYSKAIEALKNIHKLGLNSAIACCPTKKNLKEYNELLKICEDLGVSDFRMQPLMVMGRAYENLKDYIPSFTDYRKISNLINNYNLNSNGEVQASWGDPLEHLYMVKQKNPLLVFCGITAYGDVTVSPYLPISIGNIRNHSLTSYLNNAIKSIWTENIFKDIASLCSSWEEMELFRTHELVKPLLDEDIIRLDYLDNRNDFKLTLKELGEKHGEI